MATTYDNASLVMIPSGVKEDKLYSIKPTDGSGDFTFSRGSDIEATRVNSSGLIEKAKVNNLLQSNSFDTTWVNSGTTETGGQSGYDGSSNAWLLSKSASAGNIYQNISVSGVNTFSAYIKAGTLNWCNLYFSGIGQGVYFDLSGSGAVGTTDSLIIDAKIESVGGDWFRCSATSTGSISGVRIYPADADSSISGTSGNLYIQDAQVNHGLVAQDYVETTSSAVVEGLTADLPRLDYSGGASCPNLLLEPSRSNLLPHSEYFGAWNNTTYPVTITSNAATSPDGNTNATLVTPTSGSNRHATRDLNISAVSGTTYTLSAFCKKAGSRYVVLGDSGDSVWRVVTADLDEGTITNETNATGTIEPYENDWYRITCTYTRTNAGLVQTFLGAAPTDTNTSAPSFDDISLTTYVYGAQVEAGSYPTSYIPTYGTAANRGADTCVKTGITSLIGQTEGTLFIEMDKDFAQASERYIAIGDGGTANRIMVIGGTGGSIRGFVSASGVLQFDISTGSAVGNHKIALAYANNDVAFYVDGVQIALDTSATIPAVSNLYLGTHEAGLTEILNGGAKQALVFKSRLTNAELAALTTI